jgi:hypothetical protein
MTSTTNLKPNELEESLSVYNERELEYLDKYLPKVQNAFDVIIFNLGRRTI